MWEVCVFYMFYFWLQTYLFSLEKNTRYSKIFRVVCHLGCSTDILHLFCLHFSLYFVSKTKQSFEPFRSWGHSNKTVMPFCNTFIQNLAFEELNDSWLCHPGSRIYGNLPWSVSRHYNIVKRPTPWCIKRSNNVSSVQLMQNLYQCKDLKNKSRIYKSSFLKWVCITLFVDLCHDSLHLSIYFGFYRKGLSHSNTGIIPAAC